MYVIKFKDLDEKVGLETMDELRGFINAMRYSKLVIKEIHLYEEI